LESGELLNGYSNTKESRARIRTAKVRIMLVVESNADPRR
jgi:hypothetical protein